MIKNREKLKILLVSPLPPPSGGIATWTDQYIHSKLVKENSVDVLNIAIKGMRIKDIEKKYLIEELKRTLNILIKMKKFLKQNFDVVHLNSSCSKLGMIRDYLCIRLAKRKKVKIIVHFHCDTSYMVKGKFSEAIFKKICKIADKIFSLNEISKQHILKVSKKASSVIPNFIDIENLELPQKKLDEQIQNVLFVGNVIMSKGCGDIISVAKKMPHLNFKLIGKVSEEILQISLPKNVTLYGETTKMDVYNQMISTDVLLFPSYTEGFPLVVLEAMACGLPIISTPVGAIPEMIEDKGGLIVDVGNIEGFVKGIEHLENRKIREQMSLWNREKVRKYYALNHVIQQIFSEYLSA